MLHHNIADIITRIENDLALLRQLSSGIEIPTLKAKYTAAQAEAEKLRIEEAFQAGLISYDKKRGMKMVVTKSTDGWSRRGA